MVWLICRAALSEAKSQLNALKAKKNQYIMNRMTNEVAEANQQISEVLVRGLCRPQE